MGWTWPNAIGFPSGQVNNLALVESFLHLCVTNPDWGCGSRINLDYSQVTGNCWYHLLQAQRPIGGEQAAGKLHINCYDDGMHWLDCCLRICIVGRYYLAFWMVDRCAIIQCCLGRYWGSFYGCVYYIITMVIFMHDRLCSEFTMLRLIIRTLLCRKV